VLIEKLIHKTKGKNNAEKYDLSERTCTLDKNVADLIAVKIIMAVHYLFSSPCLQQTSICWSRFNRPPLPYSHPTPFAWEEEEKGDEEAENHRRPCLNIYKSCDLDEHVVVEMMTKMKMHNIILHQT
jgi:hypothetical protein